jgi:hypothetical protein
MPSKKRKDDRRGERRSGAERRSQPDTRNLGADMVARYGGIVPQSGAYGDWARPGTGGGSGARGHEGFDFPGASTWGEDRKAAEARDVSGQQQRSQEGPPRTDETIWEDLHEHLSGSTDVDASAVEIEVEEGEVTLIGRVENREDRWLIEEMVQATPGVRAVHNRLRVTRR